MNEYIYHQMKDTDTGWPLVFISNAMHIWQTTIYNKDNTVWLTNNDELGKKIPQGNRSVHLKLC